VPVYHADVEFGSVNKATDKLIGLYFFDPYARKRKRSGAWMNAYRNNKRWMEGIDDRLQ
jgi:peptidyl-dipeptidase Dcp